MVDHLRRAGLRGLTALEVGGGVGAIQIELLKAGAGRTTNIELSPGYEEEASALLRQHGLENRVERRLTDFAADDSVEQADLVVMHRVVCCYPDPDRLVGAAAARARRWLVFSYPPDNLVSRAVMPLLNLWCVIRRVDFRAYIHPRRLLLDVARRDGLELVVDRRSGLWRYAALERRYDQESRRWG
jgi:magnesium-protoporphyrin O-methyltransferase